MLKFRLRPNRYVLAAHYVQVIGKNKEYRDIAVDWIARNAEGRPVRMPATLTLPDGSIVNATTFYGQGIPVLKGKLEVTEPKFLGVVFGTEDVIPEYAGEKEVVFEALHVSNDKSYIAVRPIQPNFGCIWLVPKPGVEPKSRLASPANTSK